MATPSSTLAWKIPWTDVGQMSLVLNMMNLWHLLVYLVEDLQEMGTWKDR